LTLASRQPGERCGLHSNPFLAHRRDSEHFQLSRSGCRRAAELKMLCIVMRERSQRVTAMELIVSTSSASLHSIFTAQPQAKKRMRDFFRGHIRNKNIRRAHRNDEVSLDG
jgi:hypothetical protein